MLGPILTIAALALAPAGDDVAVLDGVVVNGTRRGAPVAGAEVILRAGEEGQLAPVARTTTDSEGRFSFKELPAEAGLIYLPGANHEGIHYPGPRMELRPGMSPPRVQLTVYETVGSPSPLVAERHDIDIHITSDVLEVTETLLIDNPSQTTYVGVAAAGGFAPTLTLSIPPEFDRVTFDSEFHGRRFAILDQRLVTSMPWPPGKRALAFKYRVPLQGPQVWDRPLDVPVSQVRLRIDGERADQAVCNLPRVSASGQSPVVFASSGTTQMAGFQLSLRLEHVSQPWFNQARWAALAALVGLVGVTTVILVRRGRMTVPEPRADRPRARAWRKKRAA